MVNVNSKSLSRIATVQAVYQYSMAEEKIDKSEILKSILDYYKNDHASEDLGEDDVKLKLNKSLLENLFFNVINNIEDIDNKIKSNLHDISSFENLHESTKSILRTGISEILYLDDIPLNVTLSEYTNIASSMIKESEIGLINSILESVKNFKES